LKIRIAGFSKVVKFLFLREFLLANHGFTAVLLHQLPLQFQGFGKEDVVLQMNMPVQIILEW